MRITLASALQSRIPQAVGLCVDDIPGVASYINEAQQRLINAAGETGFWGGWYATAFNVTRADPYITCPPEIARLAGMAVCNMPIRIQNQWYEFLEAGIGPVPKPCGNQWMDPMEAFERGVYPTAFDLVGTNSYLRVYAADVRDLNKSVIISGTDASGNTIYSTLGNDQIVGTVLPLEAPFYTTSFVVTSIQAVQKDITLGDVRLYAVDATTGAETLLAKYGPNETAPAYRRYYLNSLPNASCNNQPCTLTSIVQVKAMAKIEYQPARYPTDFLVIGNIPALKEECLSIRYGEMDNGTGAALSNKCHKNAIRLLNQELTHYLGKDRIAVNFAPFGTAKLEHQNIGGLT
jgi:hypothetical protein